MKIEFEEPTLPNFLRTKQGSFALSELTEEEIIYFCGLFTNNMVLKWKKLKRDNR